ncbi:MAG: class B sortase, partial [Lachnospiraceae bacterium]|nr:class B sortase [Lachnospiraceae bacterium]
MKSKRNVPLLLVMIASFIIFIFAAGKLIEIYLEYKKGNHTYEELMEYVQEPEADEHGKNDPDPEDESGFTFLQVDFEEIKAQNPDVAAWIQIPALSVSYPVVQGKDNSYYLHHMFDGQENKNGSIFIDYHN